MAGHAAQRAHCSPILGAAGRPQPRTLYQRSGPPPAPDWLPAAGSPGGAVDARPGTAAIGRQPFGAAGRGRARPGKKERERAVGDGRGPREGRWLRAEGRALARKDPACPACSSPRWRPRSPRPCAPTPANCPGLRATAFRVGSFAGEASRFQRGSWGESGDLTLPLSHLRQVSRRLWEPVFPHPHIKRFKRGFSELLTRFEIICASYTPGAAERKERASHAQLEAQDITLMEACSLKKEIDTVRAVVTPVTGWRGVTREQFSLKSFKQNMSFLITMPELSPMRPVGSDGHTCRIR
ncbi:uncharacterized protein LOC118925963 [Manis pentadactyla]|uniref:uncharacterized protein LOC118925963 n=1 Tax=Manis pentadactyla TaxID=143292 RepID=UPI00255C9003|nr:uncharacterized protein LOC118925963 [Manis pentadactyla]